MCQNFPNNVLFFKQDIFLKYIIPMVHQNFPTLVIQWEQIEWKILGGSIRNHPCISGRPIQNCPCILGRPMPNRPCILGKPIQGFIIVCGLLQVLLTTLLFILLKSIIPVYSQFYLQLYSQFNFQVYSCFYSNFIPHIPTNLLHQNQCNLPSR